MSRPKRIHVPGGVYYVVQSCAVRHELFSTADDYTLFERLLARALERTGALAHAYCLTPRAVHLVIRLRTTPLSRLMQGVTSCYARSVHRREGKSGPFFGVRYRAALIDPDAYLAKLIRYIHYLPVIAGLAATPDQYPHSSHRAYAGGKHAPWLAAERRIWTIAEAADSSAAYREQMAQAPPAPEVNLFVNSVRCKCGIVGGPGFIAERPQATRVYERRASLDQIIADVTRAFGVGREQLATRSRKREHALARALIGWLAVERRAATLTEVARRLNRDPSTLSSSISRRRIAHPDLFRLEALRHLAPLATPPALDHASRVRGVRCAAPGLLPTSYESADA
jgi:REP element-mobilizing transposase RayT